VTAVLIAPIVACEVGFWCLLGAGLVARYAMRLPRTSAVLLAGAPVLDLVLQQDRVAAGVPRVRAGARALDGRRPPPCEHPGRAVAGAGGAAP
jgi:hypothetical protein